MSLKPLQQKSFTEVIKHFTPNWFTLNMGTGIAFLTLHNIDTQIFAAQTAVIRVFWFMDIFFFVLFSFLFIARMVLYPYTIRLLFEHPVQSMFLGAIPMGMVPILEGFILFGGPVFGTHAAAQIALYLWWADAILAVVIGVAIPYFMFTIQKSHTLENMTAVWLLPIVASEVAASAGGMLATHYTGATAQTMLFFSYVLWALSVPLAGSVLVILFLRLATHKLPQKAMAVTAWLTLGPLGTGALGLFLLGHASLGVLKGTHLAYIAPYLDAFGFILGLLIWGYGLWWYCIAWIITLKYFREGLPFSMGWWGFTFPVGVFTAATFQLWHITGYAVFEVLALLLSTQLIVFWLIIFNKTVRGMWSGYLFSAPCLSEETGMPKVPEECKEFNKTA